VFAAEAIKAQALALGFNTVGITRAAPSARLQAYRAWVGAGQHGEMGYMARPDRQSRRADLNMILPGVQSIIMVGLDYHALNVPTTVLNDPARGRIAAYAWGVDYHDVMLPRLEALAAWVAASGGGDVHTRVYVDTGAILERSHAQTAGLGFIGKNTMLIAPRGGSYFFLGELLTDAPCDVYDTPHRETMCGSCSQCQGACPTAAFPSPYVLDARRCISYLTIEYKGTIPHDLRARMGNWVYGCDVCQDVCPFNRFALPSPLFDVAIAQAAPAITDLLTLDTWSFTARFMGTPIARIGRDRLVRNACIAAGNSGLRELAGRLETLLDDPSPLVRGHSAWACGQLGVSHDRLRQTLNKETNTDVIEEIRAALGA
jgi:epoxyqueuosine reductase